MAVTYESVTILCQNCDWKKVYKAELFTEEALEFLNGKSIGIIYPLFECEVCGTNKLSIFHNNECLFDVDNIRVCQLGRHPIPQVQLKIHPDRISCVHCLQENENNQNIPDLRPQLLNSEPCPTCHTMRNRDPQGNSHRVGRTEVRLNNEDKTPYICCSLWQIGKEGSCSYIRSVRESDEIEFPKIIDTPVWELFIDANDSDDNASNEDKDDAEPEQNGMEIANLNDEKEIAFYIEEINHKLEEIKELLEKIKRAK